MGNQPEIKPIGWEPTWKALSYAYALYTFMLILAVYADVSVGNTTYLYLFLRIVLWPLTLPPVQDYINNKVKKVQIKGPIRFALPWVLYFVLGLLLE